MFRQIITVLCLILMLAVTASWVRSLAVSEGYVWEVSPHAPVVMRHAQGAFTIACQQAGLVLSMPHWLALSALAIWPVFHLRVKLDDRKPVIKKRL